MNNSAVLRKFHYLKKTIISLKKSYRQHKLLRALVLFTPVFIYLIFIIVFFMLKRNFSITHSIFTLGSDPEIFIWSLKWWPFAVAHNLNPFLTKYIWYPSGFNLTWATSIPALALLFSPITYFLGAITSFNLIALLAPVLSATSMFYLIYVITRKYFPSLLAGYIFGFSSYELGQLLGHTHLYVTFCIPLLIMLFILRYQAKLKRHVYILLSALLLVIQFAISTEIFATFLTFSVIGLLIFLVFSDKKTRILILKTTLDCGYSLVLSLVVLSPFLYYLLKGYKEFRSNADNIAKPSIYSADLLSYIIPTPVTAIGHSLFAKTVAKFEGDFAEEGTYLGIPFILIFLYISIKKRKKLVYKSLAILFIFLVIAALGPVLYVDGKSKNLTLPWSIAEHLPLLSSAISDRFSMYIFLVLALLIGIWLSAKTSKRNYLIKLLMVIIAIVFILPNTSIYFWQPTPKPKLFQPNLVTRYIPKNSNVIILPYGYLGNSMLYQSESGMDFTQSGGYIFYTPNNFIQNPLISSFYNNTQLANFRPLLISFCKQNKVTSIIYRPDTSKILVKELKSLNWKTISVGKSTIIYVTKNELLL